MLVVLSIPPMRFAVQQDALEVTHRLVDQVDDHFGRAHGVYGSALSDMALMMKSMGQHKEATNTYLKALEVRPVPETCQPLQSESL